MRGDSAYAATETVRAPASGAILPTYRIVTPAVCPTDKFNGRCRARTSDLLLVRDEARGSRSKTSRLRNASAPWPRGAPLQQQFDDEVTVAPEYDPRFLRRVAGPDYQSFWVWTYGGNINTVDHHQVRAVAGALALKAERAWERLGLRECAQNLVLAKARLARGRRSPTHPRASLLPQPRSGSFA
jgi:hypothetical protein